MSFTLFVLMVVFVLQHQICNVVSLRSGQISSQYSTDSSILNECGVRPARRHSRFYINRNEHQHQQPYQQQQQHNSRKAKIIAGSRTKEGQFPWQASLELLHPSLGFLGHWCGGVLIDTNWVLSAAHCIHNDLFNLPLPPLWTVVLGEHDRSVESGYEQRIPVEKIVLHKTYENFLHDLVLMKLSVPANISKESNIRKICLPFIFNEMIQSTHTIVEDAPRPSSGVVLDPLSTHDLDSLDKAENYLRSTRYRSNNATAAMYPSMKELLSTKIMNRLEGRRRRRQSRSTRNRSRMRRRNDKFMRGFSREDNEGDGEVRKDNKWGSYNRRVNDDDDDGDERKSSSIEDYKDLPYIDCLATGWGKSNKTGDLTETLLKTNVPLHDNIRCHDAYGSFVRIHKGHLCAGKLNGRGGTCVGDSGGPLQCRLTKDGPWILAGITSFGSGCALEGFPDVYTRTSFYMKWITETIKSE